MLKKIITCISICVSVSLFAQDTLRISMHGADSLFLKNNLLLLAQRYRVDAAQGLTRQAKLWDNPTFSSEWNLYNPSKNKFFDVGANGEKIFAIEQLVTIAGKRNKRVALAKAQAEFSSFEFYELMRTLKLELRTHFHTIFFNSLTLQKYDAQLSLLQTIIDALQYQNQKGNIPLKEVLRLKAVYYQLNNERTDLVSEVIDAERNLQLLLQTNAYILPVVDTAELRQYRSEQINSNDLVSHALQNRPDVKMAENENKQAELNYSLQKKLAYPDLRIGGVYDQAGSYINNYTGVTFGFDLPVWNRNQGNITYAKALKEGTRLQVQRKNSEVVTEVQAAYRKLLQVEQEYRKVDGDFGNNFELLNQGFVTNFQKRNISLVEFVDFFEAYNASILQLNKLNEKRIRSYEELNYTIGEELFRK